MLSLARASCMQAESPLCVAVDLVLALATWTMVGIAKSIIIEICPFARANLYFQGRGEVLRERLDDLRPIYIIALVCYLF
jgi:hypothetical protein